MSPCTTVLLLLNLWFTRLCFSALTDPLISGIANGSKAYKLVGSYVMTPLNW